MQPRSWFLDSGFAHRAPRNDGGETRVSRSNRHRLLQVLVDLVEEAGGRQPLLVGADQQRQVLGHEAGLDRADRDPLQGRSERRQLRIVVELGAVR